MFLLGVPLLLPLKLAGLTSRLLPLRALERWAARKRIEYDHLWYGPMACGLNSAWTDLGLAMAASGDYAAAVNCLRQSWHVHPCPHSTTFGLQRRLLDRLRGAALTNQAVAEAVEEYEHVAGAFAATSCAA
jgi:hypothetical protein